MSAGAPERAGRGGDQPLPREGEGDVVRSLAGRLRALADKLESRRELGIQRYGKPLQLFNGRDPFRDHEEELLDSHNYAEQVRLEYLALVEAVRVLAKHAGGADVGSEELKAAIGLGLTLEEIHHQDG